MRQTCNFRAAHGVCKCPGGASSIFGEFWLVAALPSQNSLRRRPFPPLLSAKIVVDRSSILDRQRVSDTVVQPAFKATVPLALAVCPEGGKHDFWRALAPLLSGTQLGVQPLLAQDKPLHLAVVHLLAEEALSWPSPPPRSASELDTAVLRQQAAVAQLLAAEALQKGVDQFAAEPRAGSLGLQLAGYFAALPLDASQLPPAAAQSLAQLLLWCGVLAGRLLDRHWAAPRTETASIIALAAGRPAPTPPPLLFPAEQLQLLAAAARQCNRLLVLLQAAAAGGSSSGSGSGSSGSGGGGSSAATSSAILGQLCLEPFAASAVQQGLKSFSICIDSVARLLKPGMLASPHQLAPTCAIAEALLRLQPELSALPASVPFNSRFDVWVATAAGARQKRVWPLHRASEASQHAVPVLITACKAACPCSSPGAAAAGAAEQLQNAEAVAWYTFHLANSALKWLWRSSEAAPAANKRTAAPLPAVAADSYLLAVRLALDAQHALRMQLSDEQPGHATASRWAGGGNTPACSCSFGFGSAWPSCS